jgi:hypothetical protein
LELDGTAQGYRSAPALAGISLVFLSFYFEWHSLRVAEPVDKAAFVGKPLEGHSILLLL